MAAEKAYQHGEKINQNMNEIHDFLLSSRYNILQKLIFNLQPTIPLTRNLGQMRAWFTDALWFGKEILQTLKISNSEQPLGATVLPRACFHWFYWSLWVWGCVGAQHAKCIKLWSLLYKLPALGQIYEVHKLFVVVQKAVAQKCQYICTMNWGGGIKRLQGISRHREKWTLPTALMQMAPTAFDEIQLYCFSSKCVSIPHCVHS